MDSFMVCESVFRNFPARPWNIEVFMLIIQPPRGYRGTMHLTTLDRNSQNTGCLLWENKPSGNRTWLAGKSTINGGFKRKITELNSEFSMAMFEHQRVYHLQTPWRIPGIVFGLAAPRGIYKSSDGVWVELTPTTIGQPPKSTKWWTTDYVQDRNWRYLSN